MLASLLDLVILHSPRDWSCGFAFFVLVSEYAVGISLRKSQIVFAICYDVFILFEHSGDNQNGSLLALQGSLCN